MRDLPGSMLMAEIGRRRWDHSTDAPRLARWWLGDLLRSYGLEHELHDVVLLASELATNAVVHATSGFEIAVSLRDGRLRIEISDSDPGVPQVQYVPAGATSGRGLLIVETLSDAWGVTADEGGGKTVWFEVAAAEP
jgi:anti-sigma regulatory factor (Ser/Thr protein kinase)